MYSRDRYAQASDLGVVAHEPRHVLGEVLAGLGGEVAEQLVDLHAHVAAEPVGVGRDRLVEQRVEVDPPSRSKRSTQAMWFTPAPSEGDLVERHADVLRDLPARVLDGVAEADDLLVRRAGVVGPDVHRHRVGVVQQPGVGAQLGHVAADVEEHRDRAQGAKDGADPERVADRLAQAVLLGDVEVEARGGDAADLDRVDGEVGAVEGRATVEVGLDRARGLRRRRSSSAPSPRPSRGARR